MKVGTIKLEDGLGYAVVEALRTSRDIIVIEDDGVCTILEYEKLQEMVDNNVADFFERELC